MPSKITPADPVQSLYDSHHSWLCNWLKGRLGNAADAADLAQDTFVRVLLRQREGSVQASGIRDPYRYLATIAKGLVVDHWRRQALERAYLDELAALPEDSVPSEEQRLTVLQALFDVDAMLARLPAKVKAAFLMAQLEGLTYADIGKQLGVSDRMVRKYMVQAMHHCLSHGKNMMDYGGNV